jgi:hypothetical protein
MRTGYMLIAIAERLCTIVQTEKLPSAWVTLNTVAAGERTLEVSQGERLFIVPR